MTLLAAGTPLAERYDLVEPARDRGLGISWRASDRQRPDAPVLVKLLDPSATQGADPRTALRALRTLRHPCLPAVLGHGVHQGVYWLALDDTSGSSFGTLLDRRRSDGAPLPLARVRGVFDGALAAVMAAHESAPPLLHLALSPGSLIVPDEPSPGRPCVLLDLGVAQWLGPSPDAPTRSARGLITRPPELAQAVPPDARADVFMLAALLTEMLARPSALGETMAAVSLDRRRPDVPDQVWTAIASAMKSSRDARPASVREFAELLSLAWSQAASRVGPVGSGVGSLLESISIEGDGPSLSAPILPRFKMAAAPSAPLLGPMPELSPLPARPPAAPEAEFNPWASAVLDRVVPLPTGAAPGSAVNFSATLEEPGMGSTLPLPRESAHADVGGMLARRLPTQGLNESSWAASAAPPTPRRAATMRLDQPGDDDNAATLAFDPAPSARKSGGARSAIEETFVSEGPPPPPALYAARPPIAPQVFAPAAPVQLAHSRAMSPSPTAPIAPSPSRSVVGWVLLGLGGLIALIAAVALVLW